jgi:hypothetical protein
MEQSMAKSPVEIFADGPSAKPNQPIKNDIRDYLLWLQGQVDPSGSGTGVDFAADLTAHINDQDNPHHVTAEQLGLGDINERIGVNVPLYGDRPGDSPHNFVDALSGGDPISIGEISVGSQAVDENGRVRRVTGAATVATRAMYPLEPNKVYLVEFVVQRRVDTPDPSNDAVRCALAWYNQGQAVLTPAYTVVEDITSLLVSSGRVVVTATVSRAAGADIDIVSPLNARYVRPYFQTFGTMTQTDIEVTRWVDITNAATYSPDLTALEGRVSSIESLDLGPRVLALESEITAPSALRLATAGDLVAATVPVTVDTVELLGYGIAGDGLGGPYIDTNNGSSDTIDSADGRTWYRAPDRYVMPADQAALVSSPAIIEHWDFRWPITRFNGGWQERAKAPSVADWQPVLNAAHATEEKLSYPKWQYPVRSFVSGSSGVAYTGNVDVEMDQEAVIIAGEVFWGASAGSVLSFAAPVVDDIRGDHKRFRWKGGLLSGRELTAAHGTGSGFSSGLMSVAGYFNAIMEDAFFDIGTVAPGLNSIGAGAMDTCIGWNQIASGGIRGCAFRGPFDVAIYGIGRRFVSTLAANPLTTTSGSNVITVSAPAHGQRNGDRCFLQGIVAFNGVTPPDGEYAISGVATNSFQITLAAGSYSGSTTQNATASGAGGGSSIIFTNSSTNKIAPSILGEGSVFENNWFARCNNAISIKRNMRFLSIVNNLIKECGNGIATAGVGEYMGGEGKSLIVSHNKILRTLNFPVRLQGAGPQTIVSENIIEDWGRQIYGTFDYVSLSLAGGAPSAAVELRSMDSAQVLNNQISMLDYYTTDDWFATREPVAIKFTKNDSYISGCVDCVADGNIIRNVPKAFYDYSTGLRNVWTKTNKVRNANTRIANTYNSSTVIETNVQLSAPSNSLAAAGSATINVPHSLDFTPPKAACSVDMGSATGATVMTGITTQVTATDASNVTITLNNPTAQAGKVLDLYVKVSLG